MNERDTAILRTLLKTRKMTFQQIVDDTVPNRNSARRALNRLIGLKLMRESREGSGRGYKHWFTLTKKGRAECMRLAIDNLNESLKVVQEIGAAISSKPSLMGEFREKSREALFETKITESMPVEERVRVVVAEVNRIYGPLMESYRVMHKLIVQLIFPKVVRDCEVFIGFTKKDGIHMIPRAALESQGFEVP